MQFRKLTSEELGRIAPEEYTKAPESGIIVVLDNVRSAHNVGSAFRSCDAFKVDKLWLCGICDTPPSASIHKSALGAETSVPWEWRSNTAELLNELKASGYSCIAVEQTEGSTALNEFRRLKGEKYALVFGNEVEGVSQEAVNTCEQCLEIPQYGSKHSLNVSVAVGVVLWELVR